MKKIELVNEIAISIGKILEKMIQNFACENHESVEGFNKVNQSIKDIQNDGIINYGENHKEMKQERFIEIIKKFPKKFLAKNPKLRISLEEAKILLMLSLQGENSEFHMNKKNYCMPKKSTLKDKKVLNIGHIEDEFLQKSTLKSIQSSRKISEEKIFKINIQRMAVEELFNIE